MSLRSTVDRLRELLGDRPSEPPPIDPARVGSGSAPTGGDPPVAAEALRARPHPAVDNPVLTAADVDDVDDVLFVADPFVVRADGVYHMFFEIKQMDTTRFGGLLGSPSSFHIGHATSETGLEWTYRGVVLPAEQAEHTYPLVFRHDGEWLLVASPAGSTPKEMRVYRGDPFPDRWTLVDRALTGDVRIDPTPFEYEGTWYLLYQEAGTYDVRLRYADSLLDGEWHPHPADPLFVPGGNDVAQGGRPLVFDDHVDVFFRKGDPGIVEHWRVWNLSPESLECAELPSSPVVSGVGGDGWNGRNMHHIDAGPAVDGDSDLVIVDGQDTNRHYRIGVYCENPQ